ncbi:hypothetical protein FHS02_000599 [Massilia umbonata]|uniref:Uncharacterized protein n=1 Tax=Pseudoduganella umbonata TaxID=864828 RepID=A0A7W5E6X3_9BURK|nr:hypothetical protein [Pseudoduganella umbonata]
MVSPITAALATRWVRDATADLALNNIRKARAVRQKIAAVRCLRAVMPRTPKHSTCGSRCRSLGHGENSCREWSRAASA